MVHPRVEGSTTALAYVAIVLGGMVADGFDRQTGCCSGWLVLSSKDRHAATHSLQVDLFAAPGLLAPRFSLASPTVQRGCLGDPFHCALVPHSLVLLCQGALNY